MDQVVELVHAVLALVVDPRYDPAPHLGAVRLIHVAEDVASLIGEVDVEEGPEEVIDHDRIFVHVGPQRQHFRHGDLAVLELLGPLQDVLHLRHPANEVASNEFAPPMAVDFAVPLVMLLLAKLRLEDLRIEVEPGPASRGLRKA